MALHFKHSIAGSLVLGLLAAAMEFYPVRELVAALVIFSVLFAVAATALLVVVFLEEATVKGVTLLGARLLRIVLPRANPGEGAAVIRMARLGTGFQMMKTKEDGIIKPLIVF